MEEQKIDAVDFVSPREVDLYRNDPPVNDGRKIIFADSDHINPYGCDNIWYGNHLPGDFILRLWSLMR